MRVQGYLDTWMILVPVVDAEKMDLADLGSICYRGLINCLYYFGGSLI